MKHSVNTMRCMGYVSGNYQCLLSQKHDIKEGAFEDFTSNLTEEGVW